MPRKPAYPVDLELDPQLQVFYEYVRKRLDELGNAIDDTGTLITGITFDTDDFNTVPVGVNLEVHLNSPFAAGEGDISLGDILYGTGSDSWARLGGNNSTLRKFLSQIGTGSGGAIPAWMPLLTADIADIATADTGITSVGVVDTGTWQATVISTTYTEAKVIDITGTASRITIAGTATHPTVNIHTSYVGQASITTLGTIGTGVWQGTVITTSFTEAKVKTVTGTVNRLTIGGTSIDPTFDVSTSYVGQASITTLGTIGTGVWQGTKIAEIYGGTNQATYTKGDILYASAANTLAKLTLDSNDGYVLTVNHATGLPEWRVASGGGTVTDVTGTTNRISVSPTTGNVVVDISASYVGQASITTLGTITTGIWNAGAVTSSSTITATTEVRTPSLDTVGATDLTIQRNNTTVLVLGATTIVAGATSTWSLGSTTIQWDGVHSNSAVGFRTWNATGTDFERGQLYYSSNVLLLESVAGGVGTVRNIAINVSSASATVAINNAGVPILTVSATRVAVSGGVTLGVIALDTVSANDMTLARNTVLKLTLANALATFVDPVASTEFRAPSFDSGSATDLLLQRNNVTKLTLGNALATFVDPITTTEVLAPIVDSGSATDLLLQRNNATIAIATAAGFEPGTSATFDVGAAANLWRFVYCQAVISSVAVVTGFLQLAVSTPAQFVANTDDFVLGSFNTLRVSSSTSINLSGITQGAAGRLLRLINVGSQNIVIVNDATSTAANRFLTGTGANITMLPLDVISLEYDAVSARWRVASHY